MPEQDYLMENEDEALRLDMKTDSRIAMSQARWAGLTPGMRVADLGCGSGKTTLAMAEIVGSKGKAVGVDIAPQRIEFAKGNNNKANIRYLVRDIREPLYDLGMFDFIWVRFVLEYHRSRSYDIVKNISSILKPGGIICLIDLDYNCLNHFGLSKRLRNSLWGVMKCLEKRADFDPFVGIKLYSFLYDLDFNNIDVKMSSHHLIYGKLNEVDDFNWTKKVEIAGRGSGYDFEEYEGGYDEFYQEFRAFFQDPRRFTYTPIISCRGRKPSV